MSDTKQTTAVEWLFSQLPDELRLSRNGFDMLKQAKEMERTQMAQLVQELKDYTHESRVILGYDEREASEFVDIFYEKNYGK